jgi:hypothetical protein
MCALLFTLFFGLLSGFQAAADQKSDLGEFLSRFHSNPKEVMNELPKKAQLGSGKFSRQQVSQKGFVEAKDAWRNRWLFKQDVKKYKAPIEYDEGPERFFDDGSPVLNQIKDLDPYREGQVGTNPWSGYYWATYLGQLGYRYADALNPKELDWKKNYTFILERPASSMGENERDSLSPSEKYDLLVGDSNQTMTKQMWGEGQGYYEHYGTVESWFGLCHGWAVAAIEDLKPKRFIEVKGALGDKIRFYPSDLKALSTAMWANGSFNTLYLGGRCNDKNPATDENGRIISPDCFDTNPGVWHISVVNHVGIRSRSFVFDATYDYQVWNQPIQSYRVQYFNPLTRQPVSQLGEASVLLKDFTSDKFKKYRSAKTHSIVGVSMEVTYVRENMPYHEMDYDEAQDVTTTVQYVYDLELNEQGVVIGGEWYQNAHPDLMWKSSLNERAVSVEDYRLSGDWSAGAAVPVAWARAARSASRYGQPISKIIDSMLKQANQP